MSKTRKSKCFIPTTLAEVSTEWLTEIMSREHPKVEVIAAQVGDFFGHKQNKARVKVKYNDAGRKAKLPTSLVVKGGFKGKSDTGPASGLDIGLELELLAYAELVPHLKVNTPRCFGVSFDAKNYNGAMVLQDLAPTGATFLNDTLCLSYPQAAAFLDAMARYHAQWLGGPEMEKGGKFGPESAVGQRGDRLHHEYIDHLVRPEYWDTFVALPRGSSLPRALQDAGRVAAAQAKMIELHGACAKTIVHGDEHMGNVYLDAKGRPGFLDWCSRREPWVVSFTYFLMSTVDALDRRQWERPLLQYYLERLTHFGAHAPGFDEAWFMYRCTLVFPFLTWFNNSAKWQPESINTRHTMRAALAMLDHDTFGLLGV